MNRSHRKSRAEDGDSILVHQCGMFLDALAREQAESEGLRRLLPIFSARRVRVMSLVRPRLTEASQQAFRTSTT